MTVPAPHFHGAELPEGPGLGAVTRCTCGRWLVWQAVGRDWHPGRLWMPVRWWHRAARARIRAATTPPRP